MSKQEFCESVSNIINQNVAYGLKVYACVKDEINDDFTIKNMNILDELNDEIKSLIVNVLNEQYLTEDIEFDDISNIADNRKIIYELKQDDEYKPFECLNDINSVTENFNDDESEKLMGFIFKLNLNSNDIFIYQQAYSGTRIKNKNVLHVVKMGTDKYDLFDKKLLRIDKRAEIVIINNTLYVKNIGVLQDKFKFQRYIRGEAEKVINRINGLDIITNIDKVKECESEVKLTNAKKIMKLKNSPVLTMDKGILISPLLCIEKYKNTFEIQNGKIKTETKKDVKNLLKMLNDDYLKSELTDIEYDSSIKKEVS